MTIPDVPREKIETALRDFDLTERPMMAGWELNKNNLYAIWWQHRLYHPKQIVRMATGVTDFPGGQSPQGANAYLESKGLTIIGLNPVRETDRRFRTALERIRNGYNLPDLPATVDYLLNHEWQEIQSRLEIFPKLGESLCTTPLDLSVIQKLAQNELVGGHQSIREQVKDFFDNDNATGLIKELIGDCHQPPSAEVIDRFVEAAVKAGFQSESDNPARSNAALFASMLLTAAFPDDFVDFRQNRWSNLADLFALESPPGIAGYGDLLTWGGRLAWELIRTPTFQNYFPSEHPTWVVAGLAWFFQQEGEIKDLVIGTGAKNMNYWKISAGNDGKFWPDFQAQKIIAISFAGYLEGSLTSFSSQEAIREATDDEKFSAHRTYAAQQLWAFLGEMKEGDQVFVYGNNEIKGKGEIVGPYQYQTDDLLPYPHRRSIQWDDQFTVVHRSSLPSEALRKKLSKRETIVPLTREEAQEILEQGRERKNPVFNPNAALATYFQIAGYHFSSVLLTTFITSLQTKGFVILSGLSGTGKTKLAQHIAELLPNAETTDPGVDTDDPAEAGVIPIRIQPYMRNYARFIIPKAAYTFINEPAKNSSIEVTVEFEGKRQSCVLSHTNALALLLKGQVKAWFLKNFAEGATLLVTPQTNDDNEFSGFLLRKPQPLTKKKSAVNHIFVPVRPDWRDSKSLLGFFNPLTGEYDDTPFLRFILRAVRHYEQEQSTALPHIVILDEMNLARVEYYFADFLSIMESGRDERGYSKEAIQLHSQNPERTLTEGGLAIPRSLKLPPNLYIIGTVNMDETTHAFSPKVLDRAFTIEFNDVDFSNYPNASPSVPGDFDRLALQRYLLDGFQRDGDFARIDKDKITAFVQDHPEYRDQLEALKALLVEYDLHFGYRVFDEIMQFMAVAEMGGLFTGLDKAFDQAVLMKVLPKFNGPRGQLNGPLQKVMGWAKEPHSPLPDSLKQMLQSAPACRQLLGNLETTEFQYTETARKALRMLIRLHETGFASFA